jgi:hypothetical protein
VEHGEVDHGERRDEKVGQDAGDLYVKSRSRFFQLYHPYPDKIRTYVETTKPGG